MGSFIRFAIPICAIRYSSCISRHGAPSIPSRPISLIAMTVGCLANSMSVSYIADVIGSFMSLGCIPTPAKSLVSDLESSMQRSVDSIVVPANRAPDTPDSSALVKISCRSAYEYSLRWVWQSNNFKSVNSFYISMYNQVYL